MQLTPGERRSITTDEVAALWRDGVGPIADAEELAFVTDRILPQPEIDIRIGGTDWDEMARRLLGDPGAAGRVSGRLRDRRLAEYRQAGNQGCR